MLHMPDNSFHALLRVTFSFLYKVLLGKNNKNKEIEKNKSYYIYSKIIVIIETNARPAITPLRL